MVVWECTTIAGYGMPDLSTLWHYVVANKEWLFSGVGVAAIPGAVFLFRVFPQFKPLRGKPKFAVTFDKNADVSPNVGHGVRPDIQCSATYVHVRVSAKGTSPVKNCFGAITLIEKLDAVDKVESRLEETRNLPWAPAGKGERAISIQANTSRLLDVFRTDDFNNAIEPLSVTPPIWRVFLAEHGTYRITVVVHGDRASAMLRLRVTWRGIWNDFDIQTEP